MDLEAEALEVMVEVPVKDLVVKAEALAKVPEAKAEALVKDLEVTAEIPEAMVEVLVMDQVETVEDLVVMVGAPMEALEVEGTHIPGDINSDIKSTNLSRMVH
jgi:hypothetical protein